MNESSRETVTDKFDAMLRRKGMGRREFARSIGVSAGYISRLFPRRGAPKRNVGKGVARRIIDNSDGALTADDFLA
ncbi:MAG: hypothetical protein NW215_10590 [Hyphomicrobiales bacterium]|nr:hypothetical protein [Hyphomicrobiales bacterium]